MVVPPRAQLGRRVVGLEAVPPEPAEAAHGPRLHVRVPLLRRELERALDDLAERVVRAGLRREPGADHLLPLVGLVALLLLARGRLLGRWVEVPGLAGPVEGERLRPELVAVALDRGGV